MTFLLKNVKNGYIINCDNSWIHLGFIFVYYTFKLLNKKVNIPGQKLIPLKIKKMFFEEKLKFRQKNRRF